MHFLKARLIVPLKNARKTSPPGSQKATRRADIIRFSDRFGSGRVSALLCLLGLLSDYCAEYKCGAFIAVPVISEDVFFRESKS